MNYQQQKLNDMHLTEELKSDRSERYLDSKSSSSMGLFKITGGPVNKDGKYFYTARRQRYDNDVVDAGNTDVYLWLPNNTGELPDGTSEVNGEYHWARSIGMTVTEGEGESAVTISVWISTEPLCGSDFVEPPA
jgi:hypothetical protein